MKYYFHTLKTSGGYHFTHPNGMKIRKPVQRKDWPCGIMDDNGSAPGKHLLVNSDDGTPAKLKNQAILKIKTASTTHPGYEIMYMADSGNDLLNSNKIYFKLCLLYI